MIIGLTGGIGAGKTTVLKLLKSEYGAVVFCADEYGHMAMHKGAKCYDEVVQIFGDQVLNEYGDLDRNELSRIVYTDSRKLKAMNSIIHPFVWNQIEEGIKEVEGHPLIVIESAVLIEAGYEKICDRIWGVFCDKDLRMQRLTTSRGYTKDKAEAIMKKQMSEWELRRHCDEIIINDDDMDHLHNQLSNLIGTEHKL